MSCPTRGVIFAEPSTTNITVFIPFDTIIAVFTVTSNIICMITLVKTKCLHTPSNMLIIGLCISDILVGIVVQPINISFLYLVRYEKVRSQSMLTAVYFTSQGCAGLSFTFTIIINIDRYIAICHPFRYYEKATCRTHLTVVITTCVVWLIYICLDKFLLLNIVFEVFRMTYVALALVVLFAANMEIIKVLKRQNKAICTIQRIANHGTRDFRRQKRDRSKAFTCSIITAFFLFCYLPTVALFAYFVLKGSFCWFTHEIFITNLWSYFLVSLNSFMNPVIYCIRLKGIRKAAKAMICRRDKDLVRNLTTQSM